MRQYTANFFQSLALDNYTRHDLVFQTFQEFTIQVESTSRENKALRSFPFIALIVEIPLEKKLEPMYDTKTQSYQYERGNRQLKALWSCW